MIKDLKKEHRMDEGLKFSSCRINSPSQRYLSMASVSESILEESESKKGAIKKGLVFVGISLWVYKMSKTGSPIFFNVISVEISLIILLLTDSLPFPANLIT